MIEYFAIEYSAELNRYHFFDAIRGDIFARLDGNEETIRVELVSDLSGCLCELVTIYDYVTRLDVLAYQSGKDYSHLHNFAELLNYKKRKVRESKLYDLLNVSR